MSAMYAVSLKITEIVLKDMMYKKKEPISEKRETILALETECEHN